MLQRVRMKLGQGEGQWVKSSAQVTCVGRAERTLLGVSGSPHVLVYHESVLANFGLFLGS